MLEGYLKKPKQNWSCTYFMTVLNAYSYMANIRQKSQQVIIYVSNNCFAQ